MFSVLRRLAENWRIVLSIYVHELVVVGIVTLLYKVLVTEERWAALLAAWRPWSDASLFMASTFIVHETLYLGAPRVLRK